jgi:hypothetical protein
MTVKKKIIQQAVDTATDRGKLVFMGDSTGQVDVPGEIGKVFVMDQAGHVSKVWNAHVPNVPGHAAFVKKVDKRLQVTELWDVYTDFIYPKVGPHHSLHEWMASGMDIVRVWGDQWMPWKIEPIDTFTVRIYKTTYITDTGWQAAGTQDVALTPWTTPAGSGIYVLLSVASNGSITTTYSAAPQADYHALTVADIPALPTGNKALFAVRLYVGQTTLTYNPSVSDFLDLRHMQASGGASAPTRNNITIGAGDPGSGAPGVGAGPYQITEDGNDNIWTFTAGVSPPAAIYVKLPLEDPADRLHYIINLSPWVVPVYVYSYWGTLLTSLGTWDAGIDAGIGDACLCFCDGSLNWHIISNSQKVREGANARMGIVTLVAGTATINTTMVTANSRILLTAQTLGTILRPVGIGVTARTPGTSFTITSMDVTDTSNVAWLIMDPAP